MSVVTQSVWSCDSCGKSKTFPIFGTSEAFFRIILPLEEQGWVFDRIADWEYPKKITCPECVGKEV